MEKEWTEETALATSTGWVTYPHLRGYLPFAAANYLVGTGRWQFEQVCCWGYIVGRKR